MPGKDAPIAVITGAARGIGAATALRLARDGWALLLIDACRPQPPATYPMPDPDDLEAVADECLRAGAAGVRTRIADVADPRLPVLVRGTLAGRAPTAAIAVAGLIHGADAWATPDDAWEALLRVNLHGTRRLAEATVPAMIAAGRGRFVAVASAAGLRGMRKLGAYSAAKAAVIGYVRALAADLDGTGVTANAICPGSTRGAMLEASAAVYGLPDQEKFAEQQLTRRLLEPAEVAEAIGWLCSPAGSGCTGAVIPVDGGLTV
ncbi:MAG: mycofactocin-coupled SDR family oxidoreductase [Actinomycetes bacterium]|jgi:SDR family mycofactocin-dependent oxidoreductase|nr:MAG: SDR family mycofactocin-dependent oxidoreductase [Actinomycetota bacterium]